MLKNVYVVVSSDSISVSYDQTTILTPSPKCSARSPGSCGISLFRCISAGEDGFSMDQEAQTTTIEALKRSQITSAEIRPDSWNRDGSSGS